MSRAPAGPWSVLAWGLLGAAACGAMIPLEPNLVEEGFALHVAQRLADGEHLYRDIIFFSGPLPFELLGALFRVFGDSVWVARGSIVVLHALATAATFVTARRAGAGPFAHTAAAAMVAAPVLLFPLFSIYFHTTVATYLTLLALFAGTGASRSRRWAIATGVLVACVAISKQSIGAVLAITLGIALLAGTEPRLRARRALEYAGGGLAVALLTVGGYLVRGDLEPLIRCVVLLPLSLTVSYTAPYMSLWPPGQVGEEIAPNLVFYMPKLKHLLGEGFALPSRAWLVLTQVLFLLPWAALGGALLRGLRFGLPPAGWIYTAGLAALSVNLFPRSDWGHLVPALPAAVAQLAILAGLPRARTKGPTQLAWATAVGLALTAATAGSQLYALSEPPVLGPRVPLRTVGDDVDSIVPAVRYLREHTSPGDAIFVARAEPLIYYATETRNPTAFEGILHTLYEEQEAQILRGLGEARYVVMSDVDHPFMAFYARDLPRVHDYLERHFEQAEGWTGDLSQVQVLEKVDPRGPTLVDLVLEWPEATAWLRTAEGEVVPLEPDAIPELATRLNRRPGALILGPEGGGIDFVLRIPENAQFEAWVGLRGILSPLGLHLHPRFARMSVLVDDGTGFQEIGAKALGTRTGRRWEPMEVDLSAFGGRVTTLRLAITPDRPIDGIRLAWWGSPRITTRSTNGSGS